MNRSRNEHERPPQCSASAGTLQLIFAFRLALVAGVQSQVRAQLAVSAGDCAGGCRGCVTGPGVAGLAVARRKRSERGSSEQSSPPDRARANSYIALFFNSLFLEILIFLLNSC